MRLTALLVDVGGTLVWDNTWIPLADYRERIASSVAAIYDGTEPAWVRDLLAREFAVEDAPQYEHGITDEVAAFLAERGYPRPRPRSNASAARAPCRWSPSLTRPSTRSPSLRRSYATGP